MSTLIFPRSLNLENRKEGYSGSLTEPQTQMLKDMWLRLLALFEQPGEEIVRPQANSAEPVKKTGGFLGFGSKKEEPVKDYFLGTTIDPRWSSLPLEKALPMIPGSLLREAFWGMVTTNNPDATLLRFLRARKWDFEAAFNMLTNTLRWRLEMRINEMVSLGETGLIQELEKSKKGLGISFKELLKRKMVTLGGPDRKGRGVCFVNVQVHHKDNQPLEVMKILTVYIMETARLVCDYPMEGVCIIFNLDNFTLANMDFEVVKFLVSCFQAYYPETLGLACVHKAPWVFTKIWNLITPILDPVVASKIVFTKNVTELENYIDEGSLPIIITGDANRPAVDDIQADRSPQAGCLSPPLNEACVKAYWDAVADYESKTKSWANIREFGGDQDALDRLKLAQSYRITRVKAEKMMRGETIYHVKKLIYTDENDRLIVNYNTRTWGKEDITEWV
ncbi:CRAL-TRIO domain-containing protein [Cokeromyces recurvatus]|uniref:CRAL-TRIO domain-containing protein n=1 Tax=Cokeromyces recurvatus TaxID=90255 RepID=UPI00221E7C70|nr:CRAL-TRIO domain-containing protein [Cokeromyces recurvatus]KAI7899608.1 CRAL-TRIO domain-containing protein [Cokeromyces recurvatus]